MGAPQVPDDGSRKVQPRSARPTSAPTQQQQLGYRFMQVPAVSMDADSVGMLHPQSPPSPTSNLHAHDASLLESLLVRKARPKSACVTAAAWKAYGSPRLRGQVREPPPPSPAHPNMMAPGPHALNSRTPTVGMLGGGFNYPCSAAAAQRPLAQHRQRAASAAARYANVGLRAWHAQQRAKQAAVMHMDAPLPSAPALLQPFHGVQSQVVGDQAPHEDFRYPQTQPTDPGAHRVWSRMLQRATAGRPSSAAPAPAPHRPLSASHSHPQQHHHHHHHHQYTGQQQQQQRASSERPGSARLTSIRVGSAQQLGPHYHPHMVPGHSCPEQEHVLPVPGDARWAYSRVGPTALARLQASIKLPHTGQAFGATQLSHVTLAGGQLAAVSADGVGPAAAPRRWSGASGEGVPLAAGFSSSRHQQDQQLQQDETSFLLTTQVAQLHELMQQEGLMGAVPAPLEAAEQLGSNGTEVAAHGYEVSEEHSPHMAPVLDAAADAAADGAADAHPGPNVQGQIEVQEQLHAVGGEIQQRRSGSQRSRCSDDGIMADRRLSSSRHQQLPQDQQELLQLPSLQSQEGGTGVVQPEVDLAAAAAGHDDTAGQHASGLEATAEEGRSQGAPSMLIHTTLQQQEAAHEWQDHGASDSHDGLGT